MASVLADVLLLIDGRPGFNRDFLDGLVPALQNRSTMCHSQKKTYLEALVFSTFASFDGLS